MKKSIILFVIAAVIVAGAVVYLKKQKAPAPPAPIAETAPVPAEQSTPETLPATPKPISPRPVATAPAEPPAVVAAAPVVTNTMLNEETNSIRKTVDALLVARSGKHALFQQLNKDQLEAVIADLQQRATANPNDPAIPTTLGEAQLNLVRVLHDNGADQDQVGILAMQADQSFNAALKIDPKNWEAQFVKASTMFYWPPNEARDNSAAQMLASLIDQQETMPSQPEAFAQTYLALGNQYQKMGKTQEAMATWQLGAQKFPSDPALQNKIRGQ
jgi:cytochrome c-type biogenesis protein CcmH/NrfG